MREKAACPRHVQHVTQDEMISRSQVREAKRRDARRWWDESAQFLLHAAICGTCKFRLFHTDPRTQKIIYPPYVHDIVFENIEDNIETVVSKERAEIEGKDKSQSPNSFFPHKIVLSNKFYDNLKALTWKHFKESSSLIRRVSAANQRRNSKSAYTL